MLANIVSILIIFVDKNESLEYYESIFEFKSLNITKINLKDIRYGREPVADIHFCDGVNKEYGKSVVSANREYRNCYFYTNFFSVDIISENGL